MSILENLYENHILKKPKLYLVIIGLVVLFFGIFATRLEIDASAQTLLLENDKDLLYTRDISKKFQAPDFLVVTYSVKDDLLSNKNLSNIQKLSNQLQKIEKIENITSILNVPLLFSPPRPISKIVEQVKTIQSKDINKTLAKQEFLTSPIYKQNLVSDDFTTTVLMLNLKRDRKYFELIDKINTTTNKQQKLKLKKQLKQYRDAQRIKNHQ